MSLGTPENPIRVAIIGSGPSGFYAADALLSNKDIAIEVDIFDRLPTPHGLVRGGVAPDHPKIKSVTKLYDRIAKKDGFRFFGNVEFGVDITHDDILQHYHQIIYAVGAQTDRKLNIPGEDLPGSHPATEFVAWYNGHPDFKDFEFDLTQETAVVVGVGNVAMDVARILARSHDELFATDIADYALEALKHSNIKTIYVLGRRGPAQAAFTNPEIRELGKLDEANCIIAPEEVVLTELSQEYLNSDDVDKKDVKNIVIMREYSEMTPDPDKPKNLIFRFLTSPIELIGEERVEAVKVVKNTLIKNERGQLRPRATDETDIISAGLVFRSVGYRGVKLPDVPFREDWGTIPNIEGRITQFADGQLGEIVTGEYTVGWIKRGPSGIIGTNKPDSVATVEKMIEDIHQSITFNPTHTAPQAIEDMLTQRGVEYVTYADWLKLNELEVANGEAIGRPRVKFTEVPEMLEAVKKLRV